MAIDAYLQIDGVKVNGVRSEQTGADSFLYWLDNENPQTYSVYLHNTEGGIECVGDLTYRGPAQDYAAELSKKYGWNISDFTTDLVTKVASSIQAGRGPAFRMPPRPRHSRNYCCSTLTPCT